MQAIHDDALQLAVAEFRLFAASFPAQYNEGLKRLEQQTEVRSKKNGGFVGNTVLFKMAFMKRKTKNAIEAYIHAMNAEREKVSAHLVRTLEAFVSKTTNHCRFSGELLD